MIQFLVENLSDDAKALLGCGLALLGSGTMMYFSVLLKPAAQGHEHHSHSIPMRKPEAEAPLQHEKAA